jgi:hypothetical protein
MEYTHYRQVDAAVDKLYAQGKHEEAIALLQAAVAPFPEYLFDTLWYQAFLYCEIGQYEKAYAIMEALIQKGYFCPLDWRGLDPLRGAEGFALLQKENERLKALAQSQAKMEHAVYLPEGYDADQSYPLFIVLHGDGGGGNLEQFPWYWPPEAVTRLGSFWSTCSPPRCCTAGISDGCPTQPLPGETSKTATTWSKASMPSIRAGSSSAVSPAVPSHHSTSHWPPSYRSEASSAKARS